MTNDRGSAVVLQADNPRQLHQRRPELEDRPLEEVRLKAGLSVLKPLCRRDHGAAGVIEIDIGGVRVRLRGAGRACRSRDANSGPRS